MFHFGYGSNLSIDFVKEHLIPNAKFVMKGYLPNFEVQFPFWWEEDQAGCSGIMEAPGELVHGALYEVTEQELMSSKTWKVSTRTCIEGGPFWCWAKTAASIRRIYFG